LETQFVAVFPGVFLQSIDCSKVLEVFQQIHKDKYVIKLRQPVNWKEQSFLFEFSKNFIKEAYTGYRQKGEREFERAKSIELIFIQSYEAKLIHVGVIYIRVSIPDEWDNFRKQLAENELRFQFYHVAKNLFNVLQQLEKLELTEFKKFYTYLGVDGMEGLARKFTRELKQSFAENLIRFHDLLERFRQSLGTTKLFQLTILQKHKAFKRLMEFRSKRIDEYKVLIEREFISLLRRISTADNSIHIPLNLAEEGLMLYQKFGDGLERLRELFSSQLEISSTFFEVIGLTITLSGIAFSILPPASSTTLVLLVSIVFLWELVSLFNYSMGSIVEREMQSLISQSKVYR
jgi:hypothetical protein